MFCSRAELVSKEIQIYNINRGNIMNRFRTQRTKGFQWRIQWNCGLHSRATPFYTHKYKTRDNY
jgi:hypothetical protein